MNNTSSPKPCLAFSVEFEETRVHLVLLAGEQYPGYIDVYAYAGPEGVRQLTPKEADHVGHPLMDQATSDLALLAMRTWTSWSEVKDIHIFRNRLKMLGTPPIAEA